MASTGSGTHFEDVITVARSARSKMVRESAQTDPDLRHVVGHANVLDKLNHLALTARMASIPESPEPVETDTEHVEYAEHKGVAVISQSTPYSPQKAASATVICVSCTEVDQESGGNTLGQ